MQHKVKTMIAALMGLKSDTPSEKFYYALPRSLVDFIEGIKCSEDSSSNDNSQAIEDVLFQKNDKNIDDKLDKLEKILKDNKIECIEKKHSSGSRFCKVDDSNAAFVAQVESHTNRGSYFLNYSPLEFKCTIEL